MLCALDFLKPISLSNVTDSRSTELIGFMGNARKRKVVVGKNNYICKEYTTTLTF